MIEDTIAKIEARLRSARELPMAERQELEELLTQLRAEARLLPMAAGWAATPADPEIHEEEDVHTALGRLEESLTEFEATHPQLVGIVNRISTILANMGI